MIVLSCPVYSEFFELGSILRGVNGYFKRCLTVVTYAHSVDWYFLINSNGAPTIILTLQLVPINVGKPGCIALFCRIFIKVAEEK